jgi:nucleolar protein 6
MSLEGASKLTKKQRKSVAFRERKKGKGKAGAFADGAADVPEVEDLDREVDDAPKDEAAVAPEPPKNAEKGKGKAKAAPLPTEDDASLDVAAAAAKGKKRKRAAAEGTGDTAVPVSDAQAASDAPKKKRKKTQAVEDGEEEQGARRMILFLGVFLLRECVLPCSTFRR